MLINEIYESKYAPMKISDDPVWLATFLKTYCKEWLAQTDNSKYIAYRGSNTGSGLVYIKDTRLDRKPTDTNSYDTALFNKLIQIAGGQANRNNSVFVSGNYREAEAYGKVYVYIPIGPFSFTWSPIWTDWYGVFSEEGDTAFMELVKSKEEFKSDPQLVKKFEDYWTYLDKMYDTYASYERIDYSLLGLNQIKKHISTTDLKQALSSGNEVMIASYSGIYIDAEFYTNKVLPLLKTNQVTEGRYDPHQKKAVFLLGGPGSGKSTVAKKLFSHTGMRTVNIDHFYEMLTKKLNLAGGYNKEIYKLAHDKNAKRLELFLQENLGVVIDGTGRNLEKVKELYTKLQKLGYDIAAVFVNTDLETALSRNETRPRKVDPELVKRMHKESSSNLGEFQRVFKDKMLIIDNSNQMQLDYAFKKINNFINTKR